MNKLPNKVIILLVLVLILSALVATKFFFIDNLHWDIKQVGSSGADVYLKGFSANKTVGADLNISFSGNGLKVASVDPGGFFGNPVVIRSDNNKLSYSIMLNPENKVDSDSSKPLFKFQLLPDKLSGYKFCVLPSSKVYLSKIGGSRPKTICRNLK
ncbi:MAG: hypothetical protein NTV30_09045, partial [Chloroflexi bacterium]|nr:hypothetical protein [Chloroflexota bacterium]